MAGTEKRSRKQPDRFSVWKPGDKHAPMSVRSQEADKKRKKKEKNQKYQKKKKENKSKDDKKNETEKK